VERGVGASWNRNGAVSGLNWPLKFCSKVICYWNFVIQTLFYPMSKNQLSTGILIPIGLFCFWILNFNVFVWTASTLRQHTTEASVIITGTWFSGQSLHDRLQLSQSDFAGLAPHDVRTATEGSGPVFPAPHALYQRHVNWWQADPITRLKLSMGPIRARIAYTRAMSEHRCFPKKTKYSHNAFQLTSQKSI